LQSERRLGLRLAVAFVTIALWLTSVFLHKEGGDIFAAFFAYAKTHWGGGTVAVPSPLGRVIAERVIFSVALALGLAVFTLTCWNVLRSAHGRRAFPELLVRGAAGLLCAWGADRYLICIQSECIHFAQYGFVAFGLSLALRSPRAGFALAVFGGFLDESNQWWRIYFNEVKEHLDWSDMCLNTCGAACGALPWTALARLRRYSEGKEDAFERGNMVPAFLGVLGIAAVIVFLRTSCTLGHDQLWPYWDQLDAHKPFHQFTLKEGIPALLGLATVLYYVVDERRRNLPVGVFVFVLVAWHIGLSLPSDAGIPLHENVPVVTVPHAKGPIAIDGKIDEKEWEGALKVSLGPFAPTADEDDRKKMPQAFGPEQRTQARLLWDEKFLYIAFECETKDVWARDLPRDDERLAQTPCVEVFLDPDNAEHTYYEFEFSAANRQADYFCYIPEIPQWVPAPTMREFVNLAGWDSKNLQSAVSVQGGEVDLVGADAQLDAPRQNPATQGYTVEIAIPWHDMQGRSVSPNIATSVSPVKPGAVFRMNLYRIEPCRPATMMKPGTQDVIAVPTTYMAWSPTHAPLDFHRPQFFGQLILGQ
jgi:hypothetical protein